MHRSKNYCRATRREDRRKTKKTELLKVSNPALFVGVLGLEPRMTGPESVVLPLHHTPKFLTLIFRMFSTHFLNASAKVLRFFVPSKHFRHFFQKKLFKDLTERRHARVHPSHLYRLTITLSAPCVHPNHSLLI